MARVPNENLVQLFANRYHTPEAAWAVVTNAQASTQGMYFHGPPEVFWTNNLRMARGWGTLENLVNYILDDPRVGPDVRQRFRQAYRDYLGQTFSIRAGRRGLAVLAMLLRSRVPLVGLLLTSAGVVLFVWMFFHLKGWGWPEEWVTRRPYPEIYIPCTTRPAEEVFDELKLKKQGVPRLQVEQDMLDVWKVWTKRSEGEETWLKYVVVTSSEPFAEWYTPFDVTIKLPPTLAKVGLVSDGVAFLARTARPEDPLNSVSLDPFRSPLPPVYRQQWLRFPTSDGTWDENDSLARLRLDGPNRNETLLLLLRVKGRTEIQTVDGKKTQGRMKLPDYTENPKDYEIILQR